MDNHDDLFHYDYDHDPHQGLPLAANDQHPEAFSDFGYDAFPHFPSEHDPNWNTSDAFDANYVSEPPHPPAPDKAAKKVPPDSSHGKNVATDHTNERLISTPDHEPHVVLAKKFKWLLVVFIIMLISAFGATAWSFHQTKFGYPPTEFSQTAYTDTLSAMVCLFVVSLFTIIIIRGKVHHLMMGYLLMFAYCVTFYFSLKGASRAFTSIKYDDIVTIEKYLFENNDKTQGKLPHFFHRLQINFKCCGTHIIDKMEDWPEHLQSKDMPDSCCQTLSSNCGKLLARTYNYKGDPNEPMRMPSGYFISVTEAEMDRIEKTGKPEKIVRPPGMNKGVDRVLSVLKEHYFNLLKGDYAPGTSIDDISRLPNDIVDPIYFNKDNLPTSIGCSDNSALEKVTTIGWQIQRMLDRETSMIHSQENSQYQMEDHPWIAWKIPMCQEIGGVPPFHLASNFKRDVVNAYSDIKHMWYLSKGITENVILKNIIWGEFCESDDKLKLLYEEPIVSFIHGNKNTGKMSSAAVGAFFINFVNKLMVACLAISIVVAILLFIVFLIFWHYYSRMKLEEYANLPYPPEFEALKVRQNELFLKHNKDEYDKNKYKALEPLEPIHEEPAFAPESYGPVDPDYEEIKAEFDRMFASPPHPSVNPSKDLSVDVEHSMH